MSDITPLTAGVPADRARVLCVVIHGRHGAPETMMRELVSALTAPDVHYLLPRAEGQQWYTQTSCAPLDDLAREQVAASVAQIDADIRAARAAGAPTRMVLGGFSQGACMSLEYACAMGAWDGALFALTGSRVGSAGDERPMADVAGLPMYLGSGAQDPFIRMPEIAETLRLFADARALIRADLFPRTAHVMSPPEIAVVDGLLRSVAAGVPPLPEVFYT